MSHIRKEIVYFDSPGPENTEEVLRLAKERAKELNIKDVVVASTRGETGVRASEVFKGFNVVVISHYTGFVKPGVQQMSSENRRKIERNGGKVHTCMHAFAGVDRAIRYKFGTYCIAEIMAETLKIFGEGTKVAVEITMMAADAGLIPIDKDVIAIAGTSRGADTALVIQPANSTRIFNLTIKEIVAKPRTR
jgi:hypothetical protein